MKPSNVSTPCRACGREMLKYPATPYIPPEYKGQKTYPIDFIDYETLEYMEKYLPPGKFDELKEQFERQQDLMAAFEISVENMDKK